MEKKGSEGGRTAEEGNDGNDKVGDNGETSVEVEGKGAGEGMERVSATMFSGPRDMDVGACELCC